MGDTLHSVSARAESSLPLMLHRLQRIEFLLTGQSDLDGLPQGATPTGKADESVTAKLHALQTALEKLRKLDGAPGSLVRDIEILAARYPDVFASQSTTASTEVSNQASVVLSHAASYPETASRLSSLQTLQIPSAEQSAKLADLRMQIRECQREQNLVDQEVQDLRQRSARCLEWWVKTGVVGMGDLWEEWENRVLEVERYVTQFERRKREQEGYL